MTSLDAPVGKAIRHWPIVLLRIYTGVFFVYHGFGKIRRDNFSDGVVGFLNGQAESTFSFYRPFVESIVFIVLAGLHAGRTMGLDEKLSGKYKFLA
jgi:uncharacterized membrane protein YphA (DoxX/SURF4 family)